MSCMTISQVLDLMVSLDCGWVDYGSREATCGQELRGSGWRWAVDDRGCVVLESENGSILFKDDLLQYRKARQMSDQGRYDSVVGLAKTASAMFGDPNAHESVRATEQPAWSGDGLPPVGAVVEYRNDGGWWCANVIGHYKDMAIVADVEDDMCVEMARVGYMRPTRTDEEKAVEGMYDLAAKAYCKWEEDTGEPSLIRAIEQVCKDLYADGYRKTEGV